MLQPKKTDQFFVILMYPNFLVFFKGNNTGQKKTSKRQHIIFPRIKATFK